MGNSYLACIAINLFTAKVGIFIGLCIIPSQYHFFYFYLLFRFLFTSKIKLY